MKIAPPTPPPPLAGAYGRGWRMGGRACGTSDPRGRRCPPILKLRPERRVAAPVSRALAAHSPLLRTLHTPLPRPHRAVHALVACGAGDPHASSSSRGAWQAFLARGDDSSAGSLVGLPRPHHPSAWGGAPPAAAAGPAEATVLARCSGGAATAVCLWNASGGAAETSLLVGSASGGVFLHTL